MAHAAKPEHNKVAFSARASRKRKDKIMHDLHTDGKWNSTQLERFCNENGFVVDAEVMCNVGPGPGNKPVPFAPKKWYPGVIKEVNQGLLTIYYPGEYEVVGVHPLHHVKILTRTEYLRARGRAARGGGGGGGGGGGAGATGACGARRPNRELPWSLLCGLHSRVKPPRP